VPTTLEECTALWETLTPDERRLADRIYFNEVRRTNESPEPSLKQPADFL